MTERRPKKYPLKSVNCPRCGSPIVLRAGSLTKTVACESCFSILDASSSALQSLKDYRNRLRINPLIPIGSRGIFDSVTFEVVGFMERAVSDAGVNYPWREYLLFNPYNGFRFLLEENGHWNFFQVLDVVPTVTSHNTAQMEGLEYRLFQEAESEVSFVLGEFYWEVRLHDKTTTREYINPPFTLSVEQTQDEISFSRGRYLNPGQVVSAFSLKESLPSPRGVVSNQPNPYSHQIQKHMYLCIAGFIGLIFLYFHYRDPTANERIFETVFEYSQTETERAKTSSVFEVRGDKPVNIDVTLETSVKEGWLYANIVLINADTNVAKTFGRELSRYVVEDEENGGYLTEGSLRDTASLSGIIPGKYYILVDPDKASNLVPFIKVSVTRGSTTVLWIVLGAGLLILPLGIILFLSTNFEKKRTEGGA